MAAPLLLVLLSLAGIAAALLAPGRSELLLAAGPALLASLLLLLRAARRGRGREVVVDGSNVMHWRGSGPRIETVRAVVALLRARGLRPHVVFDANAGHLLWGRYAGPPDLARALGLPAQRVTVVQSGTPADPVLLAAARRRGARIVSNDRFRDWAARHPEVRQPGQLLRGGYRGGRLWLDPATAGPRRRAR